MRNTSIVTKTILVAGLAVFMAMGASQALAQHEGHGHDSMSGDMKGDMNKQVTLVGEVLDMYCFMQHPADGQGPDHAKCAQNCIKKGLPIGFLAEDGEVYLIIGKEHESAKDLVVNFPGMQSRLTGTLISHDGIKAIEIESIEKVDAKSGS
jgi:hypothetical protein